MRTICFVAAVLGLCHGYAAYSQEIQGWSSNGSEGFRPKSAQTDGVDRVEVLCLTTNVEENLMGPVEKDIQMHAGREARRLFPNQQFVNANTKKIEDPAGKYLYLDIRVYGSGFQAAMCGAHIEITANIIDAEGKKQHRAAPVRTTMAVTRQTVVKHIKQSITDMLEMVSDGWYNPKDSNDPIYSSPFWTSPL
jgi:hypothetical protein